MSANSKAMLSVARRTAFHASDHAAQRKSGSGRASQARSMLGYAEDAFDTYRQAKAWWEAKTRWTVSVDSSDRLYGVVLRWFLETDNRSIDNPRAIKAVQGGTSHNARMRRILNDEEDDYSIDVLYDEKGTRNITVQGHKVTVAMYRPEQLAAENGQVGQVRMSEPDRIQFHAKSLEGQQAVLAMLRDIAASQNARKPGLHLMSQWGDWMRRDDLPTRDLSTVVLRAGQMERLTEDLENFLEQEPDYIRRGIPYHRGYLLHGEPGTGKTSVVRALAANFGLDLWYAPLGDLQKDTSLISLINQVHANSILLLEDVDVFHSTRNRDDDDAGVSMAGLLNALDGVATPHGLIVFMTTNDLSVIDDAVIRPGRIDVREEIGLPDQDQVIRLWESWYARDMNAEDRAAISFTGSTAALTELFKQNLNDADASLTLLQNPAAVDVATTTVHADGGNNGTRQKQGSVGRQAPRRRSGARQVA